MNPHTLHDQLLRRIKARDKTAIVEAYELYFKPCAKIVLKDGGTLDDAREVFQEAMFSLINKLENDPFAVKRNLKGYLGQSCFNLWVEMKRKRRKLISSDEQSRAIQITDSSQGDIEQIQEKEAKYLQMYACIKKLKPECQQLLNLSFFEKKPDLEIAPIMNYQLSFVKQKRQRCMKSLRACMGAK